MKGETIMKKYKRLKYNKSQIPKENFLGIAMWIALFVWLFKF